MPQLNLPKKNSFNENFKAVDYFGEQLLKAGYNYHGNEPIYSGILGTELHADIFVGPVYYQRLRHMVLDKWQVRGSSGAKDVLVNQPVGGRRRGGGVRFGEMERDSLLAHGVSFLLKDRLMNCSDKMVIRVCSACGSAVSPMRDKQSEGDLSDAQWTCKTCQENSSIKRVFVPGAFRYLISELGCVNIRVILNLQSL